MANTSNNLQKVRTPAHIGDTGTFKFVLSGNPDRREIGSNETSNVLEAVSGYVKAVRSLGRTRISTHDISRALDIPLYEVNSQLEKLSAMGVRLAK